MAIILTQALARQYLSAAEADEWITVGDERNRTRYWLPERIRAKEWLCLIGFDELEDEAGVILARHRGRLTLNRLRRLSDAGAQALSCHRGESLELNTLTSLTDAAARSLSRYQGFLSMDGIATLTADSAAALAERHGRLSLDGLTSLPDTPEHLALARMLAAQPASSRASFKRLTHISEAVAEVLADLPDFLNLNSLHLTEPLAAILARHSHCLRFDHSPSITEGVARALANCQGGLCIDVGPTLSPDVAKALVAGSGFWLSGLTSLSEATADILAEHEGVLTVCCFSLTSISAAAAESLARHKGPLRFVYAENLPPEAAEILRRHIEDSD
jgi:hypothetical protein